MKCSDFERQLIIVIKLKSVEIFKDCINFINKFSNKFHAFKTLVNEYINLLPQQSRKEAFDNGRIINYYSGYSLMIT